MSPTLPSEVLSTVAMDVVIPVAWSALLSKRYIVNCSSKADDSNGRECWLQPSSRYSGSLMLLSMSSRDPVSEDEYWGGYEWIWKHF